MPWKGGRGSKITLFRLDSTYAAVNFAYTDKGGKEKPVSTLEELEYPSYFNQTVGEMDDIGLPVSGVDMEFSGDDVTSNVAEPNPSPVPELKEQHVTFMENQRGVSYDGLIGPYTKGAKHITITDPYIRLFYQARNLMELMETLVKNKAEEDEVVVSLITVEDDFKGEQQRDFLEQIQSSLFSVGIKFAYAFDNSGSQHARHIVTDTGWKISPGSRIRYISAI